MGGSPVDNSPREGPTVLEEGTGFAGGGTTAPHPGGDGMAGSEVSSLPDQSLTEVEQTSFSFRFRKNSFETVDDGVLEVEVPYTAIYSPDVRVPL